MPSNLSSRPPSRNKKRVNPMVFPIDAVMTELIRVYKDHPMSEVTQGDPFKVLIACIMSLRTRDDTTMPLAEKFFQATDTPQAMAKLSVSEIERYIYPVGFYKTKAKTIKTICEQLVQDHNGVVPDEVDVLAETFKGVGRKTANLVVALGYQKPAICVDVHVHRICKRMGFLDEKTPDDTEIALRKYLPKVYWGPINTVMVRHGQLCCKPIGPLCSTCPVEIYCEKRDVTPKKAK